MGYFGIHEGTGLPVYEEDDVAWLKADMAQAPLNGKPLLRRTEVDTLRLNPEVTRGISLIAFIAMVEGALDNAAKAIGAEVAPHKWGLASVSPHSPFYREHELVPNGYRLIASVENLSGADPLSPEDAIAVNALTSNFKNSQHDAGYYMYDLSAGQCVTVGSRRVLIDIEPRLASDGASLNAFDHI